MCKDMLVKDWANDFSFPPELIFDPDNFLTSVAIYYYYSLFTARKLNIVMHGLFTTIYI